MTPAELKSIRQSLGLSAEAFAKLVRVATGRTVRRWESGEQDIPGPVTLIAELSLGRIATPPKPTTLPIRAKLPDAETRHTGSCACGNLCVGMGSLAQAASPMLTISKPRGAALRPALPGANRQTRGRRSPQAGLLVGGSPRSYSFQSPYRRSICSRLRVLHSSSSFSISCP